MLICFRAAKDLKKAKAAQKKPVSSAAQTAQKKAQVKQQMPKAAAKGASMKPTKMGGGSLR